MRVLIVIAADQYVRNLVEPGAFAALDEEDVEYVASGSGVVHEASRARLAATGRRVTYVDVSDRRQRAYANLQLLIMWTLRRRSRTMRVKSRLMPLWQRLRFGAVSSPGLRGLARRWYLWRTGPHAELQALLRSRRPDVVVAPSGGTDALVTDTVRTAHELGVPSIVIAHNWDNLSSKGAFAVTPDVIAVWGEQSARHAEQIHGLPRERVAVLGSPSLDSYFRHSAGATDSPFPFPFVLFAGCFAPFDERAALRRLDAIVEAHGLDLKIVYRPHPHRQPRRRPDRVDDGDLLHVVLDPGVRDVYAAHGDASRVRAKPMFPPLEQYPALLEHARFVITPLSTMIVEAAIFECPVIVIAYDDGVHPNSPAVAATFEHFDGLREIRGLKIADEPADLDRAFLALAGEADRSTRPSLRAQIGDWLYHDERPYAERLAAAVREAAAPRPATVSSSAAAPSEGSPAGRAAGGR